jgi:spermidine synthase
MNTHGTHLLCELSHCDKSSLESLSTVRNALDLAAHAAKATVLNSYFHQFTPVGVTGFLCLAESHISIHTWPERNYAAVDIYTCGETMQPKVAIDVLSKAFSAGNTQIREVHRGVDTGHNIFSTEAVASSSLPMPINEPSIVNENEGELRDGWYLEAPFPYERHSFEVAETLLHKKSKYQEMLIIRNEFYGKILFLDGASQSAQRDEHIYHEALIHPALLMHRNPRDVLILGGGEGASLREVLRHKSVCNGVMVDIDGELVQQCRKLLPEWSAGAYEDPRSTLIVADGKSWIEHNDYKFDVIIMDLTDQIDLGPSFPLYTQKFYKDLKSHLNPGGILIIQAGALSISDYFSHCAIRKTLASVFKWIQTYTQHVPSFFSDWSFVVATDENLAFFSESDIDQAINQRLNSKLKFYDGETHTGMFKIPKNIRSLFEQSGAIVTNQMAFKRAYEESLGLQAIDIDRFGQSLSAH